MTLHKNAMQCTGKVLDMLGSRNQINDSKVSVLKLGYC